MIAMRSALVNFSYREREGEKKGFTTTFERNKKRRGEETYDTDTNVFDQKQLVSEMSVFFSPRICRADHTLRFYCDQVSFPFLDL